MDWPELQIDHIIPQILLERPTEMSALIEQLNLAENFSLESLQNLVPTHQDCNRRKLDSIFDPGTLLFYLELARKYLPAVEKEVEQYEERLKRGEILARMELGLQAGLIARADVQKLLERAAPPLEGLTDPIVVCFGVNVLELQQSGNLPSDAPTFYPQLCDYLEKQLEEKLKGIVPTAYFPTEPSQRTGETLSVRIAFAGVDVDKLDYVCRDLRVSQDDWGWEILEIAYYSEIYGEPFHEPDKAPGD